LVPTKYKEDWELAKWVKAIREKKSILLRKGIEAEVPPFHGNKITLRTLTADRVETLESMGFAWIVGSTKELRIPWEERFRELVEYREENGRWPSQTVGGLGLWVHRQRKKYSQKDEKYMLEWAPKLDKIGFEWAPRGNTSISWDDGFRLLVRNSFNLVAHTSYNGHPALLYAL